MTRTSRSWKHFLLIFLALETCALAVDFDFNYGTQIWNVAEATKQTHAIGWYQADSWHKDYIAQDADGSAVDLGSTNLVITWDVVSATNLQEAWIAETGLVISATSGIFRLSLTPTEANLQTGYYFGFVRASDLSGTNIVRGKLLVKQTIQVLFSSDSRYYTMRGPMTYQIQSGDVSNLTEAVTEIAENVVAVELADFGDDYYTKTQSDSRYMSATQTISASVTNASLVNGIAGGAQILGADTNVTVTTDGTNITIGVSGAVGPEGPQGPAGASGTNGWNGINGTNGANGATGPQGPAGTNGVNGTNGTNGWNGVNGTNGANGATGPQGPAGTNGVDASSGVVFNWLSARTDATGSWARLKGKYFRHPVTLPCAVGATGGGTATVRFLANPISGSTWTTVGTFNVDAVYTNLPMNYALPASTRLDCVVFDGVTCTDLNINVEAYR